MTQPPLKLSRRWVPAFALLIAAGLTLYFIVGSKPLPPRALEVKRSSGKPTDYSHPFYSKSELVPDGELRNELWQEGFADGFGISSGVTPPSATDIPIEVEKPDANGIFHAYVDFHGKRLRLDIESIHPDPDNVVAVTDFEFVFVDTCGPGAALVFDKNGKRVAEVQIGGHAHTRGCIAPKRGLLVATRFAANVVSDDVEVMGSEVTVFDYRKKQEVGVIRMPNTQFNHFAISRDEKSLLVGFGDGTVRRFDLDSAKPRAEWPAIRVPK